MNGFEGADTWVAQQIGASSGIVVFALLLLGGTLASLLPCVYPLYPVTAAILSRRQSELGRFAHPLAYYLGLIGVYFAFGVIASITGGSFNELLRLPVANLSIGAVFVLLALATGGILDFPALGQGQGPRGDSLLSTVLMGSGAGLLSSACVGPVVVGILISVASSTTQLSLGATLSAASQLMVFGMGLGLPLALIAVFGVNLPKGGAWMVLVQRVFAVAILWFALGYLLKGLAGFGFSAGASWGLFGGVLLVAGSVFFAQSADRALELRARQAVVVVAGVIGVFVVGRILLSTALVPSATAASATPVMETRGNLTWHSTKESAYAAAARTGRPVFIDFYGDWCSNCKAFEERTLADRKLNAALAGATLLKVRDTTALFEEYKNDPRFPELSVGLPFFLITNARGELLYKTTDYTQTEEMALFLLDG